jgi:glycosyltransferase involved in cell wall biosynthesis
VKAYERHAIVRCFWQDQPRGKGAAVRVGLEHARGDIILIQDADTEYDVADYDGLLAPILSGQSDVVLGSRHSGNWKIREFESQLAVAAVLNAGHLLFTTLLNVASGQRLKDPFTMYKVFRRECLAGLTFRCNRFDFDIELLMKLLRKGYVPLEVPVSYRSRSFGEGKKVRPFRDPLTWLVALMRSRFGPL